MAMEIAEELRLARQKAITRQVPVGVVFPSDGGTKAHTQSFYVMEGETNPRITKTVDYSRKYPSSCAFIGYWEIDANELSDPSRTNTVKQPDTGSNEEDFDVTKWGAPQTDESSKDYLFLLLPSGAVKTNGLPNFDGSFHIVVTKSVAYEAGQALPSAFFDGGFMQCFADLAATVFFRLARVCQPYTVNISPLGDVTVTEGVTGADDAQLQVVPNPEPLPAPASPPASPGGANGAPAIADIAIRPSPNADYIAAMAAPVDATVKRGGSLTLTTNATDADGDPLFCTWSSPDGAFSSGEQRMEWDADAERWVSIIEWRPPDAAPGGTRCTLTCSVDDKHGHTTVQTKDVEVVSGKIAFISYRDANSQVYTVNPDGTGLTRLSDISANFVQYPCLSPDGTKIAFMLGPMPTTDIWVMNSDGTGSMELTTDDYYEVPSWSPDGNEILCARTYPISALRAVSTGGGNQRSLGTFNYAVGLPVMSPDGSRIIFDSATPTGSCVSGEVLLWIMNSDGTNVRVVKEIPGFQCHNARWSPDGSKVLFYGNTLGQLITHLYTMVINPDGTGGEVTRITNLNAHDSHPRYSPDGNQIVFDSDRDGTQRLYIMDLATLQVRPLTSGPDSMPSWSR
jgi:TolB protein